MRTGHLVFVRDYHVLKYVCGDFFFFLIFLAHLEETFHEGSQILTTGPQFELNSYSHDDETEMCPLVCYFAVFEIVQSSSLPLFFIFYFFFSISFSFFMPSLAFCHVHHFFRYAIAKTREDLFWRPVGWKQHFLTSLLKLIS